MTCFFNTSTGNFSVTLRATIKNIGQANAGSTTTRFTVSPLWLGGIRNVGIPSIAAGQTINATAYYALPGSNYSLQVIADVYNGLNESNENNNQFTTTFTV